MGGWLSTCRQCCRNRSSSFPLILPTESSLMSVVAAHQASWVHPDVSRTLEPASCLPTLVLMHLHILSVSLWFHLFLRFFSKVTVLEVPGSVEGSLSVSRNEKEGKKKPASHESLRVLACLLRGRSQLQQLICSSLF